MLANADARPVEILLVEDNPADVRLTREGFKSVDAAPNLHVVSDGIEALNFLYRRGVYADAPRPDMILLDLNLPRMSGHEVLSEIRRSEGLDLIPIVILTSSQAENDILESYARRANCYIAKPLGFSSFVDMVKRIDDFWFSTVCLPSAADSY